MMLKRTFLLGVTSLFLVVSLASCATSIASSRADYRARLEELTNSSMNSYSEFLDAAAAFLEAHARCEFSREVLDRVTFGKGHLGLSKQEAGMQTCIGVATVASVIQDTENLASIELDTRRPRQGSKNFYILALYGDGGWVFYWPQQLEQEIL